MFALITPRGNSTWRRSKRAHPATALVGIYGKSVQF